jgi:hypothetical protein
MSSSLPVDSSAQWGGPELVRSGNLSCGEAAGARLCALLTTDGVAVAIVLGRDFGSANRAI